MEFSVLGGLICILYAILKSGINDIKKNSKYLCILEKEIISSKTKEEWEADKEGAELVFNSFNRGVLANLKQYISLPFPPYPGLYINGREKIEKINWTGSFVCEVTPRKLEHKEEEKIMFPVELLEELARGWMFLSSWEENKGKEAIKELIEYQEKYIKAEEEKTNSVLENDREIIERWKKILKSDYGAKKSAEIIERHWGRVRKKKEREVEEIYEFINS